LNYTLIAGSNGFLGSYLVNELLELDYNVIGIDRNQSVVKHPNYTHYKIDISSKLEVINILSNYKINSIFYLAGIIKETDDRDIIFENVYKYKEFISSISEFSYSGIFNLISTCAVYGQYNKKIKEDDCCCPVNIYGLTKLYQENIALEKLGNNVNIFRLFNLVGPGQKTNLLISSIINKLNTNINQIDVFNPASIRDYIDIRDAVMILSHLAHEKNNLLINLCTSKGYDVYEIVNYIKSKFNSNCSLNLIESHALNEVKQSVGCNKKLLSLIDYKFRYNIYQSIDDMIKHNFNG
jgi:nucleoside-diphosphate-sugar epimerase